MLGTLRFATAASSTESGQYAALYRHGTHGKHVETDRKYAEARRREQEQMRAWEDKRDRSYGQ